MNSDFSPTPLCLFPSLLSPLLNFAPFAIQIGLCYPPHIRFGLTSVLMWLERCDETKRIEGLVRAAKDGCGDVVEWLLDEKLCLITGRIRMGTRPLWSPVTSATVTSSSFCSHTRPLEAIS
jgi:hypothetical protein